MNATAAKNEVVITLKMPPRLGEIIAQCAKVDGCTVEKWIFQNLSGGVGYVKDVGGYPPGLCDFELEEAEALFEQVSPGCVYRGKD